MKRLIVATHDKMTFEVNRETLEPKTCEIYDAHIFSDPPTDCDVVSFTEWSMQRSEILTRLLCKIPADRMI